MIIKRLLYNEKLVLGCLIGLTAVLRVANLGYSELQGDEIRILYTGEQDFWHFLLAQKKGPVQFLVERLVSLLVGQSSEFLIRLPFTLAGIAAVVVLYLVIRVLLGRKAAFFGAFLFSVNGFFVAFSRIAQYQSFTILFALSALLCFVKLARTDKTKYLFLGGLCIALGFLSHYDALFIAIPSSFYVFSWLQKKRSSKKFLYLILAAGVSVALTLSFYVPFFLNERFSEITKSYLFARVSGVDSKKTDVLATFNLYNPFLTYYFLLIFSLLGIYFGKLKLLPIYVWLLVSYVVFGKLVAVPGTHIYNYVIPLIVLSGYGVSKILTWIRSTRLKIVVSLVILSYLMFFYYQSYALFVDHTPEFPWNAKKILIFEAKLPSTKLNLSLFGFPYNRHLKEVDALAKDFEPYSAVSSNEGSKIIKHYINPTIDPDSNKVLYVYVYGAQSLVRRKISAANGATPAKIYYNGEVKASEVYILER